MYGSRAEMGLTEGIDDGLEGAFLIGGVTLFENRFQVLLNFSTRRHVCNSCSWRSQASFLFYNH